MDLLKRPDINAPTTQGQLQQIKDYLDELASRINYNLWEIDRRLTELREDKNG